MKAFTTISLIFISCCSALSLAYAGTTVSSENRTPVISTNSPFDQGSIELQAITGVFFSLSSDSSDQPTLNHTMTNWRIGWMLNDVAGDGVFRGNYELMAEASYGRVFKGPGNYLGGAGVQMRYNFVQADTDWIPYAQIGVGGLYNDIYKDESQSLIDHAWELNLQAAVGVRYLFSDRWAISLEGGYRHVSDLNSLGAQMGLSHFF